MAVSCNSRQPKPSAYPSEPQDKNTAVSTTNAKPAASDNDIRRQIEAATEGAYIFGQVAPGSGNASSPAWSTSSTSNDDYNGAGPAPLGLSPQNNKAADKTDLVAGLLFDSDSCSLEQGAQQWLADACSQEMFPALLATTANTPPHHSPAFSDAGLAFDARSTTVSAATHPESMANTSADAVLDGWLQQFVNADAIGGATTSAAAAAPSSYPLSSHLASTVYSPDLPFYSGVDAVAALLSSSASPGLSGIAPHPGKFSFESAAASVPVLSGIMPLQASPVMHGSPFQSPLSTGTDVLDQTTVNAFAAAAAAVAASSSSLPSSIESISPELLASVLSSGVCAYGSALVEPQELLPPAASEISMLAALPFTSIAMPAANIAPQKTLSVSHSDEPTVPDYAASYVSQPVISSLPLPPSKRQRRSVPSLRKASSRQSALEPSIAGVENASGRSSNSSNSNQSSSTGTTASAASKKGATTLASPEKDSQPKTAVPHTLLSRPIAPSSSSSGNGSHSMVPLAPRQPATQRPSTVPDIRKKQKLQPKGSAVQNEDKKVADTCPSSESSSGSSTPPGLSVLAKIAQKQVPIRVKEEEDATNAANQQNTYQGRLIAPSPAKRQTRSPSLPPVTAEEALSPATNSGDSTVQKRQERLIKNRAAALLSRKRKRDYMTKLESEVEDLRTSNTSLIKRMEDMERAMKALAEERDRLRGENEAARVSVSATTPSTGATAGASSTANNNSSSNATTEKSEEKAKEQGESSEASDGKNSDAVEASDDTMDIDSPLPGVDVVGQQQRGGANSKQRTAGALLMAMLFSFSLFTLPSMYTSSNQITAGGPQSAGIIPIRSLPSPEPRLLIGSGKTCDNAAEPPLIERVRRSITALAQQAGPSQPSDASQYANGSDSSGNWMRPMTMEESAELHAWIRHGLAPKDKSTSVIVPRSDSAQRIPKVVVEHVKDSTARADSVPNSLSIIHQQMREANDYAMLYCPTMQHVVFGGDSLETADMNGYLSASSNGGGNNAPLVYSPSAPRVIDTAKQQHQQQQQASEGDSDAVAVVHGGGMMDDVDSEIIASPRVADWHTEASSHADLVPTHVGKSIFAAASSNRPKMSLYSPIVGGGSSSSSNGGGEILPPWDEYARLVASSGESEEQQTAELAADNRQKYLRIDVEVVGSRWVTADKFAHGLY